MKSILYVGATLMIGASIYGFVDYKKTSHSNAFKEMYGPAKTKAASPAAPAVEEKVLVQSTETNGGVKREFVKELPVTKSSTATPASISKTSTLKENKTEVPARKLKKRKLRTEIFSRAPLREEMEEVELPKPVKTEPGKTAAKEQ